MESASRLEREPFFSWWKKILIKYIAQAIPIYTMSCFKLPKSICDEINRTCARFWWGSSSNKKKIHWLSWNKMCMSKGK